jgi:hypothetical protein
MLMTQMIKISYDIEESFKTILTNPCLQAGSPSSASGGSAFSFLCVPSCLCAFVVQKAERSEAPL